MIYAHQDELLTEVLDGEAVVLKLADRSLHRLDPVATQVWLELEEPSTPADLLTRLSARFQAPQERIAADVDVLLASLVGLGLLRQQDA